MNPRNKITPELIQTIQTMYLTDKLDVRAICKQLGVSHMTVHNHAYDPSVTKPKCCAGKDCQRAGEILPVAAFGKRRRNTDGLNMYCLECARGMNYRAYKKREVSVDMSDCTTRDPYEKAKFGCPICGSWAGDDSKAFQSQADANECCSIEKRGDAYRMYECPVHKGMESLYSRPNSEKVNQKYANHFRGMHRSLIR